MASEQTVIIAHPGGLHARPAARVVQLASEYACQVEIVAHGKSSNARSVLSLMKLGLVPGSEVTVRATGDGADAAVERIAAFLSTAPEGGGHG